MEGWKKSNRLLKAFKVLKALQGHKVLKVQPALKAPKASRVRITSFLTLLRLKSISIAHAYRKALALNSFTEYLAESASFSLLLSKRLKLIRKAAPRRTIEIESLRNKISYFLVSLILKTLVRSNLSKISFSIALFRTVLSLNEFYYSFKKISSSFANISDETFKRLRLRP